MHLLIYLQIPHCTDRVTAQEIQQSISKQLEDRGVKSRFQFAVYSNNLATKVRSKKFDISPQTTFRVPLFENNDINKGYQLYVNFYEQERDVWSTIFGMSILSLCFTSVIFIAFYSALEPTGETKANSPSQK